MTPIARFVPLIALSLLVACGGTTFSSSDKASPPKKTPAEDVADSASKSGSGSGIGSGIGSGTGSNGTGSGSSAQDLGQGVGSPDSGISVTSESRINLCSGSAVKTAQYSLNYPATRGQSCDWNKDGNLNPVNSGNTTVRAVRVQAGVFQLPTGAVLCALKAEGHSASLRYDDYMILTFDGFLLAAAQHPESEFLAAGMQKIGNAIRFERLKAVGSLPTSGIVNKRSPPQYCPSGASCQLPLSDQDGAVALQFPAAYFNDLPLDTLKQSTHDLSLIITGQGDGGTPNVNDCGQSGLMITVTATYIVP